MTRYLTSITVLRMLWSVLMNGSVGRLHYLLHRMQHLSVQKQLDLKAATSACHEDRQQNHIHTLTAHPYCTSCVQNYNTRLSISPRLKNLYLTKQHLYDGSPLTGMMTSSTDTHKLSIVTSNLSFSCVAQGLMESSAMGLGFQPRRAAWERTSSLSSSRVKLRVSSTPPTYLSGVSPLQ